MAEYIWQKRRMLYPLLGAIFLLTVGIVVWYNVQPVNAAAPSTPSITSPSAAATEQHPSNLVLTSSTFSGSPSHTTSDWRIVNNAGSCSSATGIVWEVLNSAQQETINVNSLEGGYSGDQNGKNGLKYNTTYKACVRHTNGDGTSGWSSEVSFTTEDLANATAETDVVINNSGSVLNNYQVRLQLDDTDIDFGSAEIDGSDIRFSDSTDTHALPHFIADYDNIAKKAAIWVRVDSLTGSGDTTITMHYDGGSDSIRTNAGDSVFIEFTDENDLAAWDNGWAKSAFNTFAASGDYIHVVDSDNTQRDAMYLWNADAIAASSYAVEYRMYVDDAASTDVFTVNTTDGAHGQRYSDLTTPHDGDTDAWTTSSGGTRTKVGDGLHVFGTVYEYTHEIVESPADVDYYIYSSDRASTHMTDENNSKAYNSPTDTDRFQLLTAVNGNKRTDSYIDFLAVRDLAATEPTMSSATPQGSVPSAASITAPTASQPGRSYNPIISATYSGDYTASSADWKIVKTSDCNSGIFVWNDTGDTVNTATVIANSLNGTWSDDQAGKDALQYGTTYYACARHSNVIGAGAWSSPVEFTVENVIVESGKERKITFTTTQSTINNSQVFVHLDNTNMSFASAQADGGDLRFMDSTKTHAYPYWIESYDNVGETADVHILVDTLPTSGTVDVYMVYDDTDAVDRSSCQDTMVECQDFEDNDVSDWVNVDLTSITTTGVDQFDGSYAVDLYRSSGSGGGSTGDGYWLFKNGPYTAGTHAVEFMEKPSVSSKQADFSPFNGDIDRRKGLSGVFYNTSSNLYRIGSNSTTDTGVNYSAGTWYKSVNYLLSTTQYDAQLFTGTNKSASPLVDTGIRSMHQTMPNTNIGGLSMQRLDGAAHLYVDNVIVRKTAAADSDGEPTNVVGTETILGAPFVTIPASIAQLIDASGYISFTTTIQDSENDETRLQVQFSKDGGSTWLDPDLVSATPDKGAVDLDDAQTYQVGTVNGIDTDTEGLVTLTIVWDTKSVSNEGGAISLFENDVQLRVVGSDGTYISDPNASANFNVDNVLPTGLGSFSIVDMKLGRADLSWSAATDDTFDHYEIWYGTNQTDVQNRNGTAVEWDNTDDAGLVNIGNTVTSVMGLNSNTLYYFKIWAVDSGGNEQTVADLNGTTDNLASWGSYQEVTVDNTGNSAHANLQIDFSLPKGDFPGMDANCDDVRVLDFDQKSEVDFWIEDCDTTVRVWAEVPSISNNASDEIYIYYNNGSATNASNGKWTFLDFIDENDVGAFNNGNQETTFSTLESSGGFIHIAEAGSQINDASYVLNAAVEAQQDYVVEFEVKSADQAGDEDVAFISIAENSGTLDDRYSQISQSERGDQDDWTYRLTGGSTSFGASTFAFDTIFRHVHQTRRSASEVDYYIYDTDGNLETSALNKGYAKGAPDSADLFYVLQSNLDHVDVYIDWVFFRKFVTDPPTMSVGPAPNQPSISAPSNLATGIDVNASITGSASSGGGSQTHADWQISDDNTFSEDCSDINIVWCKQNDTTNLTSTTVTTGNGVFQNARNAASTLDTETDYWVRTRYKNAGGWSAWSNSNKFTTAAGSSPVMSNVSIDAGAANVALNANTTKDVIVTGTATDTDGCSEITGAELKLYRTDLGNGGGDDPNHLYTVSCAQDVGSCTGGADTTATYTCTAAVQYYADPTDVGSLNAATDWTAQVIASDLGPGTMDTDTIEMNTLTALNVTEGSVNFGNLGLNSDTSATNQTTTIVNTGNENIDITVSGYGSTPGDGFAMSCDSGTIPVNKIKYKALTGFTYGSGGTQLSGTATEIDLDIPQRTAGETNKLMRWGLGIPSSGVGANCTGTIVFAAVSDPNAD